MFARKCSSFWFLCAAVLLSYRLSILTFFQGTSQCLGNGQFCSVMWIFSSVSNVTVTLPHSMRQTESNIMFASICTCECAREAIRYGRKGEGT
ncbi:hypothetical protein RB195_012535 [Necator americanus]|uniref:Secreted protein n=1 Tax=Necator americanus TaxID=51031 RepID=A0ABR1DRB2_NECAM